MNLLIALLLSFVRQAQNFAALFLACLKDVFCALLAKLRICQKRTLSSIAANSAFSASPADAEDFAALSYSNDYGYEFAAQNFQSSDSRPCKVREANCGLDLLSASSENFSAFASGKLLKIVFYRRHPEHSEESAARDSSPLAQNDEFLELSLARNGENFSDSAARPQLRTTILASAGASKIAPTLQVQAFAASNILANNLSAQDLLPTKAQKNALCRNAQANLFALAKMPARNAKNACLPVLQVLAFAVSCLFASKLPAQNLQTVAEKSQAEGYSCLDCKKTKNSTNAPAAKTQDMRFGHKDNHVLLFLQFI